MVRTTFENVIVGEVFYSSVDSILPLTKVTTSKGSDEKYYEDDDIVYCAEWSIKSHQEELYKKSLEKSKDLLSSIILNYFDRLNIFGIAKIIFNTKTCRTKVIHHTDYNKNFMMEEFNDGMMVLRKYLEEFINRDYHSGEEKLIITHNNIETNE